MFLLVPAYPGSPGQRAVKRVCVLEIWLLRTIVCVISYIYLLTYSQH